MGESNYFHYSCKLTNIDRIVDIPQSPQYSTNASMDKQHSEISAIAEALERYCAIIKNYEEEQIYISFNDNSHYNLIPINNFPICADYEYTNSYNILSKPNAKQKYYWTKCYDLINNKSIYVPSSFIFLQFNINSKDEILNTPNSTATAGGQTLEEAIINAVLEGLERDAIMITWLNQLPRSKINLNTIDSKDISIRIKAIQKLGTEIFLFDISTDFNIPIILCIIRSDEYPYYIVSAAAKLNPINAISRALDEGYATRKFALFNKEKFKIKQYYKDYQNVINFDDHLYLYNKPNMHDKFNFLVKSKDNITINSLTNNHDLKCYSYRQLLEYFIIEFQKRGMNFIIKDITTSDLSNSIFKFVKVFIPELVWLTPNHNYRFLKNKRIKNCLRKIGFSSYLEKEITNLPHPFA
jgi:ribosomal protein S12 methylthiotransferase accessory factor